MGGQDTPRLPRTGANPLGMSIKFRHLPLNTGGATAQSAFRRHLAWRIHGPDFAEDEDDFIRAGAGTSPPEEPSRRPSVRALHLGGRALHGTKPHIPKFLERQGSSLQRETPALPGRQ